MATKIKIPSGATLSGLASQYGTTIDALLSANPQITNPNLIYAGADLTLPMSTQTGGTRDVMLQSGDPASMINLGREQAGQVADSSAYQKFGLALMDLLKQQQTMGTRKFEEAGLAGREAAAERVLQTPQDLIGAHPSLQAGVRSAQAGAMQPQISGAREMGQTFSEQLRAFGDSLSQARAIGSWMEGIDRDTRQEKMNMMTNYPEAIKNLSEPEKRQWEKDLGLPKGFIDQIPTVAAEQWQQITLSDGSLAQQNTKTGEIKVLRGKEESDQIPAWFIADIHKEYAERGLTPLPHVIEKRWFTEKTARDKYKWEKGGEGGEEGYGWDMASASDRTKATGWISRQPGSTPQDIDKLKTDPDYFYWALDRASEW